MAVVLAPLVSGEETLHSHKEFRFALFECRGGRPPELDNMGLLGQLGRLVARIHVQGEMYDFEHRPTLDIASFGDDSHDYLLKHGFIPEAIEPAYRSICADLLTNVRACYERAGQTRMLRLHGDFHPGNVLVDGEMHVGQHGLFAARSTVRAGNSHRPSRPLLHSPGFPVR